MNMAVLSLYVCITQHIPCRPIYFGAYLIVVHAKNWQYLPMHVGNIYYGPSQSVLRWVGYAVDVHSGLLM